MSSLLLNDWQSDPLTVESIMDRNLSKSPVDWRTYPPARPELTPSSGCQQAGFRHTVGSLWDMIDGYPPIASVQFYKTLGNADGDSAVPWAVHCAARRIQEMTRDSESDPRKMFAWVAYIHTGP